MKNISNRLFSVHNEKLSSSECEEPYVFESEKKYEVSYSDFLAAALDPEMLCGEANIELLFHTLNPSHMATRVLKSEMKDALFFGIEDENEIQGFNKIKGKKRDNKILISKEWITSYFYKIKKVLIPSEKQQS